MSKGLVESLSIPLMTFGVSNYKKCLFNNELYVYANIKGTNIKQPLFQLPDNAQIETVAV